MANELYNQLQQIRSIYRKCDEINADIEEMNQESWNVWNNYYEDQPDDTYEDDHYQNELKERAEAVKARIQKIVGTIVSLFGVAATIALMVITFQWLDRTAWAELNDPLYMKIIGFAIFPGFLFIFVGALLIAVFYYIGKALGKLIAYPQKPSAADLTRAKEMDQEAEKKHNEAIEAHRHRADELCEAIEKKNQPVIDEKEKQIQNLMEKAAGIIQLPEEYCNTEGVDALLEAYEPCCADWCKGRDPESITQLVRYCAARERALKKQRAQEADREFERLENQRKQQQQQQQQFERDMAYMDQQWRTREAINRQTKAIEELSKKLED